MGLTWSQVRRLHQEMFSSAHMLRSMERIPQLHAESEIANLQKSNRRALEVMSESDN